MRSLRPCRATALFASLFVGLVSITPAAEPEIVESPYGRLPDGQEVKAFTLRNATGLEARIGTLGGALLALKVPDRHGQRADIVLGFERLEDSLAGNPFFGVIIGRYANRIAGGRFTLDGQEYQIAHDGPHALHGGLRGFDKAVWSVRRAGPGPVLELEHLSPAGDQGFPGNLRATAVFRLTDANELRVDFSATADAPTVCSFSYHPYFNLAGRGDILAHTLQINASRFTPLGDQGVPDGRFEPVKNTPFDFTRPKPVGRDIDADHPQLKRAGGYDHNWALESARDGDLALAATLTDPSSGRRLEIHTNAPGLQVYSANFLRPIAGKEGRKYGPRQAICLEPQHFPDAPNQPTFPSPVLRPGETYRNTIVYRFSAE